MDWTFLKQIQPQSPPKNFDGFLSFDFTRSIRFCYDYLLFTSLLGTSPCIQTFSYPSSPSQPSHMQNAINRTGTFYYLTLATFLAFQPRVPTQCVVFLTPPSSTALSLVESRTRTSVSHQVNVSIKAGPTTSVHFLNPPILESQTW
jgi:hypothetical protein